MIAPDPADLLPEDLLERVRARAAGHDRDGTFPHDDLADLAATGYLAALVPRSLGGAGFGVDDVTVVQQRLAGAAPATALAVNMHLVWTAVARLLADRGDASLRFVLEGAASGEVFAFGISEAGNDLMLRSSETDAAPLPDGGYAFTGTKVFTSLSPVWTHLGVHGLDTVSADAPKLVFAFVPRSDAVTAWDDWDTLGMRATQSRTTVLAGAVAAPSRVIRRLDPGPNDDPLMFAIFAAFELLISSVYLGIARRALDLAVTAATGRTSRATGRPRSDDPGIRHRIAEMGLDYDGASLAVTALARDLDAGVDHGARWPSLLSGTKHRVTAAAKRIVDDAMQVSGGGSFFARTELSRLYRDVLAGVFHPSDARTAHATVATAWLGPAEG